MTSRKTKHQKRTEQNHQRIIQLYNQLKEEDMPRTVLWETISDKTGYTREGIQRVLRINGIDYSQK